MGFFTSACEEYVPAAVGAPHMDRESAVSPEQTAFSHNPAACIGDRDMNRILACGAVLRDDEPARGKDRFGDAPDTV
jgi:hypothetical protein